MNYVDLLILVMVALFAYMGYLRGFIRDFADLLALVGAVVLAAITFSRAGAVLTRVINLPAGFANTVGFFLVWFVVMLVYYGLMTFFYDLIPDEVRKSRLNRWSGLVPAFLRGVLFVWFTINLLFLLAVSGPLKQTLGGSFFSRNLVKSNVVVSNFVSKTFGPAVIDTVNFLTVKPQSNESVSLGYTTTNVTVDKAAAQKMFALLNVERKSRGLKELAFDDKLAKPGEEHARDMFARGYFSHNTPEGLTPFDRMDAAGISYLIAGENLALAPSTDEAFTGLMNSPGHRANMLSTDYGRVGIGAIDGGIHGEMFAQEFTN